MGYFVHIIRKNDYADILEKSNITLDEWLCYIESDPELSIQNGFFQGFNNEDWIEQPGYCDWTGHPRADCDTIPSFNYKSGEIFIKTPDDPTIEKMIKIADALNAKVINDDDEFLTGSNFYNGRSIIHTDTLNVENPDKNSFQTNKPLWKFW